MTGLRYTVPNSDQLEALMQIQREAFNTSMEYRQRFCDELGHGNFRVLLDGGNVAGGLAVYPAAQYFGGQVIPSALIAAVAVDVSQRGRGYGLRLMQEVLQECADAGYVLSTLYPEVFGIYLATGYGPGGHRVCWAAPPAAFATCAGRDTLQEIDDSAWSGMARLYHERALGENGLLLRHPVLVKRLLDIEPATCVLQGARGSSGLEAYLIGELDKEGDAPCLHLRDWHWTTKVGFTRSCRWLATQTGLQEIRWMGGPVDPAARLLGGPGLRVVSHERWLLRLLDARQALLNRIWPAEVNGTVAFSILDPLLAENATPFAIRLEQGAPELVSPVGHDCIEGDVSSISSLYTGMLSASALADCGRITGPRRVLELLDKAFAGTDPWMVDYF
jgi:predicted acetyltransferase